MAQKIAFKAASDDLSGATVSIGDGKTFDILAALKKGDGKIVLDLDNPDDNALAETLRVSPAVTETTPKKETK